MIYVCILTLSVSESRSSGSPIKRMYKCAHIYHEICVHLSHEYVYYISKYEYVNIRCCISNIRVYGYIPLCYRCWYRCCIRTYIQHYRAQATSCLVKSGREVLSLSVYLLPPLKGQGPWEWRSILRTNYERGASGMYLLLHPFPISQWYISWGLLLYDSPPIPIHHLISVRYTCGDLPLHPPIRRIFSFNLNNNALCEQF